MRRPLPHAVPHRASCSEAQRAALVAQSFGQRIVQMCHTALLLSGFAKLTRRQHEVLPLLLRGLSNGEIAGELGISARTVEEHVATILKSIDIINRTRRLV